MQSDVGQQAILMLSYLGEVTSFIQIKFLLLLFNMMVKLVNSNADMVKGDVIVRSFLP